MSPVTPGDGEHNAGEVDDPRALRDEVARLTTALEAERAQSAQWREVAEERRATLERFRQHPLVRAIFWLAGIVLPPVRRAQRRTAPVYRRVRRTAGGIKALPDRLTAGRREGALARAIETLPAPTPSRRTASLVVLTRDGRENCERLTAALAQRTRHEAVDLTIVDNASGPETAAWIDALAGAGIVRPGLPTIPVRVVRNTQNLSFSVANNEAAAGTTGEVVVLLNDDVEPIVDGWLQHLLATLEDDDVVAAGAHLVYPRRGLFGPATRDLGTQHLGTKFRPSVGGVPVAVNVGEGSDAIPTSEVHDVPAATAACLAVQRSTFDAVGGFDDRYAWGQEDVDLCWRLREHGRIVVAGAAVLFHHEGATRHRSDPAVLRERQAGNRRHLEARFGPALSRAVLLDQLTGALQMADRPAHVAITVTRDLAEAGYGDWMTAHELGDALTDLGMRVSYVERYQDAWYDLPSPSGPDAIDVLVVLIDLFDLRRLPDPAPMTVAWIRNHPDRWGGHAWFDQYDVVLASSQSMADDLVAQTRHHTVEVFPLATNPARFDGDPHAAREGIVFTGNHWGREDRLSELVPAVPDLVVHGKGWQDVPAVAPLDRGPVPYDELPAIYRRARLVLDQAAGPTAATGSLNSRIFDALAAGALPVTSQAAGARALFGEDLPTWEGATDLAPLVAQLQASSEDVAQRVDRLRAEVLAHHTYPARAARLRDLLVARVEATSFVLATSCPDRKVAPSWGDWHLALAMARELQVLGHRVDVITMDEWTSSRARAADVFVQLRGRSVAPPAEGQTHVIWSISHPEELTPEECEAADLVLVGSELFAAHLRTLVSTRVAVMAQATDERRFQPRAPEPTFAKPVGFLGNSRFVLRPVVEAAVEAGLDLTVWGANWEKFLDPSLVAARHVDNADLPRLYSSVGVLLNDHWDGMRQWGYVSNRLFDALACGAVVVSDEVPGMDELFDGAVATWTTSGDLAAVVTRLLDDPDERNDRAARGRAAVLARHTFAHRAAELLGHLDHLA